MSNWDIKKFIAESNAIENIHREPTDEECEATLAFLALSRVTVADLENLVSVYAPGNCLRDQVGFDVHVGSFHPMKGGPHVRAELEKILEAVNGSHLDVWFAHIAYERLHPFTDGNGRSGRALWLWMLGGPQHLSFLHLFYYQTLRNVAN